jgi:hypothetical protein
MKVNNADSLLIEHENAKMSELRGDYSPPDPDYQPKETESVPLEDKSESVPDQEQPSDVHVLRETSPKSDKEPEPKELKDEYGNEIVKETKTYTQEEVEMMVRDRLSRGRAAKEVHVNPPEQGFKLDSASSEPWEVQLDSYIDRRIKANEILIQSKQEEEREAQWRAREDNIQAQFQAKFNAGMNRYKDFNEVVEGKPITDNMMMAARSLSDPAAFIYAASKNHAAELEKIAQIQDSYAQVAAIGRLEERMKKPKTVSKAPSPPSHTKGDMTEKVAPKRDIDRLIQQHAKVKFRR